mgnify:CR=1 FL=1
MHRITIALAGFALLLAADAALAGPSKGKPATAPKEWIQWSEDYEAAKTEAAERNVPIVFAFHKDH